MKSNLVINVVGLSPSMIGQHTPNLLELSKKGGMKPLDTVIPAVTCSVQSTLLTGLLPNDHGIVANGWFFKNLSEVLFWRQPNQLVKGEKIWEKGKKINSKFTCAKMFWWYNMYSTADWSATPRPMYPADGRKIPDHYTYPPDLKDTLDSELGKFPLFKFWGPLADITSSKWIAESTKFVMKHYNPTLALTYLPHLDYNLQRLGPDLKNKTLIKDLNMIDTLCGELIDQAYSENRDIIIVSEYGITPVTDAIHINKELRSHDLLSVRNEMGRDVFDPGASKAFAVSDHQLAHIYIKNKKDIKKVKEIISNLEGVEMVLDSKDKSKYGLDHHRSGELVAISNADRWFSYYYWLDDKRAPDYAKTVDIHRKPGYDPVELFFDPSLMFPKVTSFFKLMKRKIGFRNLLDVISLKRSEIVRGSHGRITDNPKDGPLIISSRKDLLPKKSLPATDFKDFVLDHIFK
ncbi:nucleotide pyrophosphatase/phosphodiesterase family protein [Candidatus Levibacter sp. Uisw_134_01]|uniref:alkaline phosphatase family protein n=1 Tax=Candidatus Levibacter sp. Uisw_134_01 TaxID=3230999 RepID=UPI003D4323F2